MTLNLTIGLLQPLINGGRSADITDVIANTAGGMAGYFVHVILWDILYKCFTRRKKGSRERAGMARGLVPAENEGSEKQQV